MKFTVDYSRVSRAASPALIACSFSLLWLGAASSGARAQTPEIIVTYNESNGTSTGNVQEQSAPINTGNNTAQTNLNADYDANADSVPSGDGMILTPIVDPEFLMNLALTNETTDLFTSFRFSLPTNIAGAFFDPNQSNFFGPSTSESFDSISYEDRDLSGQTRFKTIVFEGPISPNGVPINGFGQNDTMLFRLVMFLPEPTNPGQGFYLDLRPNDARPGQFPPVPPRVVAAPEPGSLVLLLAFGGIGALCRRKR